jgi:hypothetical protein
MEDLVQARVDYDGLDLDSSLYPESRWVLTYEQLSEQNPHYHQENEKCKVHPSPSFH